MSLLSEETRPSPCSLGAGRGSPPVWGVIGIGASAGVVQWVSPSVEDLLGYQAPDLVGRPGRDLVRPDDVGCVQDAWRAALAEPGASQPAPATRRGCRQRDGSWRELELVFANLGAAPGVQGTVW